MNSNIQGKFAEKMLFAVIFLYLVSCVWAESYDVDLKLSDLRETLQSRFDSRIDYLENELRSQKVTIQSQQQRIQKQDEEIQALTDRSQEQDTEILALKDRNQEQDEEILALKDRNQEQDEEILAQQEVIEQMRRTMSSVALGPSNDEKIIPSTKSYYTSFGCLADELTLSCPNDRTIFVTSADYGQYSQTCDTECCPPHPYDCTELMSSSNSDEWLYLKLACDNQTSCTYLYQGSTFVENCSPENTASYVAVYYSCLPEAISEPVGFSAYTSGEQFYDADDLIMFTDIESNFGSYYNTQSSTFLCPQDGIYIFLVSIFPSNHYALFGWVMKDNEELAQFRSDDDLDFNNRHGVSNSVITECLRGEKVWVRCIIDNSRPSLDARTSSFSGYLLHKYA